MDLINPFWTAAAAMGLYLNSAELLRRFHHREPVNLNLLVGTVLTGTLCSVLCGR